MIEIRGLVKHFGQVEVLKGVDITIPDGSIYGLVGVSGAGKSTLLRCINGLETFDEGTVVVNGTEVKSLSERELRSFRKEIGMIFQHFSLLERKTVFENVAFPMKCHGYTKEETARRVRELLELVGLADKEKARPRELSGGQKQRVAIARALTMNPRVLLCDEATSALDPNITRSILDLLKEINRTLGITIVIVTHAMSVVKEACDSVAILEQGVLSYEGDVQELFFNRPECIQKVTGAHRASEIAAGERAYVVVQRAGSEDVLSRLALETGVRFRVSWGALDVYKDQVAGSYTIVVDRNQAPALEGYLKASPDIEWRFAEGRAA